jgi:16S rRNA (uracil1498-N3)-methyltransferase
MRTHRLYLNQPLAPQAEYSLPDDAFHYLCRVLRLDVGTELMVFNGQGGEFNATLYQIDKKSARIRIGTYLSRSVESPLHITLALGISKNDHMDYALQKAVELGVSEIYPLLTEYTVVNLRGERQDKRHHHWEQIIINACHQSTRNIVPTLHPAVALDHFLDSPIEGNKLVLHPYSTQTLSEMPRTKQVCLLIGPEGGLSEAEIQHAQQKGFSAICFGPRILRTETAAMAAVTALQTLWGDLG